MTRSRMRTGIVVALLFMGRLAFGQTAGNITGSWKSELKDKPVEMEIVRTANDTWTGKVINDTSKPSKNGRVTLENLKYDQASQSFKGTFRPPDADVELNATVTMVDNNRLKVVVKKMLMSRTMYLARTK